MSQIVKCSVNENLPNFIVREIIKRERKNRSRSKSLLDSFALEESSEKWLISRKHNYLVISSLPSLPLAVLLK